LALVRGWKMPGSGARRASSASLGRQPVVDCAILEQREDESMPRAVKPRPEAAPSPKLSLEQVLAFIRGLDEAARSQVAQALAECEMDARFEKLIRRLAGKKPGEEISDVEIQAEINAVRRVRAGSLC